MSRKYQEILREFLWNYCEILKKWLRNAWELIYNRCSIYALTIFVYLTCVFFDFCAFLIYVLVFLILYYIFSHMFIFRLLYFPIFWYTFDISSYVCFVFDMFLIPYHILIYFWILRKHKIIMLTIKWKHILGLSER